MKDNYIILSEIGVENLQKQVNEKIQEGYEPIGGPFISRAQYIIENFTRRVDCRFKYNDTVICQAMIRK